MSTDKPGGLGKNTTIESTLVCPDPSVSSPTADAQGPFPIVQTVGIYQNPQPGPGWRPRLTGLTLVVQDTTLVYNVTLAPEWVAAFVAPVDAPLSVADLAGITAAAGPMLNPRQHPIFFRRGAPAVEALALVFLSNRGYGYLPPVDSTGRYWGLLVRANNLPIGGIVSISTNWEVERDPKYLIREKESGGTA